MKITGKFVESLARMSDEEQKTANLLVNKWFHLTKSFTVWWMQKCKTSYQ